MPQRTANIAGKASIFSCHCGVEAAGWLAGCDAICGKRGDTIRRPCFSDEKFQQPGAMFGRSVMVARAPGTFRQSRSTPLSSDGTVRLGKPWRLSESDLVAPRCIAVSEKSLFIQGILLTRISPESGHAADRPRPR